MTRLPTPEDMAAIQAAVRSIRPAVEALEAMDPESLAAAAERAKDAASAVDPERLAAAARAVEQAQPALDAARRALSGDPHRLFGTRIRSALETLRR